MAANEKIIQDILWEQMKDFAIEHQQYFYELLPSYTIYNADEHEYLKQNIGYAIYGPPVIKEDTNTLKHNDICYQTEENVNGNQDNQENQDKSNVLNYDIEAQNIIDTIYKKICEYTINNDNSQVIYFGIIYNITFRPKVTIKLKKNAKAEKDATEVQEPTVVPIPVFKFKRNIQKKVTNIAKNTKEDKKTITEIETDYETWYIDINSRIYKNWKDYKTNNNLPKCTMILPKNGCYVPDPSYPITEDGSTVWVEIIESFACKWQTKLRNGIDVTSSMVGIGTLGLGVASFLTPIGPTVALAGLVANGVVGVWSIGRCSHQLIDRSSHEESIHPLNKDAFSQWLGLAGSTFGISALGGSAAISKAVARGMTVNTAAKVAFNTLQGGNLFFNGAGIIYQSYCMIDKYKTEKSVDYADVVNLVTHTLFFCGSVLQVKFAGDIIKTSQSEILDDYKNALRNRRLRKAFKRIQQRAAANNTCEMAEKAEVIRYIRNRTQLSSANAAISKSASSKFVNKSVINNETLNKSSRTMWSFENGKLKINNIALLDPIEFATHLINLTKVCHSISVNSQRHNNSNHEQLTKVFSDLLSKLYPDINCTKSKKRPVSDFEPLLKELNSANVGEDFLKKLFAIAVKLMKRSKGMEDYLINILHFIWKYCQANLRQWGLKSSFGLSSVSACNTLCNIIGALFEAIDMVLDKLFDSLVIYITANLHSSIM